MRPSFVFKGSFSFFLRVVSFVLFYGWVVIVQTVSTLVQSSINEEGYLKRKKKLLRLEVWENNHFLSHISFFFQRCPIFFVFIGVC